MNLCGETLNFDLFSVFCDFIYIYDSCNCISVYLNIFMIIKEAQNRPNLNNGILNGCKHQIQMIFSIEDTTQPNPYKLS